MSVLATIAFQPEAYDSAADAFRQIQGYTVDVVPTKGERFTAELLDVIVNDHDGQYRVVLARWDEQAGRGNRNDTVTLDIYDELERMEVV